MLASPEPGRAFATIAAERVTHTAVVPAIAGRWLDHAAEHGAGDLASLRVLEVGGARLADELARRVRPMLGCTLQQVFGMAEGLLNYTRLDDPDDVVCSTQGRPMCPDDEVRLVDAGGGAAAQVIHRVPMLGGGELVDQGVLGGHDGVGHAEAGVGPGGEDPQRQRSAVGAVPTLDRPGRTRRLRTGRSSCAAWS